LDEGTFEYGEKMDAFLDKQDRLRPDSRTEYDVLILV
jgi:hypothetical protein